MSLSINHPIGKVTSTTALSFEVQGGTPAAPRTINLSASSVIMPNVQQPVGQSGAIIFDSTTKRMKYYDGTQWISWVPSSEISGPITTEINNIYNELGTKIDSVIYNSNSVPSASISGTTLNITFPTGSTSGSGTPGLFTSLPTGSISYYSLISGQTPASIREQMGGSVGSQNGRSGTQASPYITSTGWTYADGNYWLWQGADGNVVQKVPNLNQNAYMKSMSTNGITKTDAIISASGSIGDTSLTVAQLPPHSFSVSGSTNFTGGHTHKVTWNPMGWNGSSPVKDGRGIYAGSGSVDTNLAGDHSHTVSGTTNTLGSGASHTHPLNDVDVTHFNVAVLYNIAQPSLALNQDIADTRYVLKSGDVMTGTLTIASSAIIRGNDSNLVLWFRNSSNAERAAIYHNSSDNTLRFRANGGNEVYINNTGTLTAQTLTSTNLNTSTLTVSGTARVSNKYVALTVNNVAADSNGNITIVTSTVTDIRLGALISLTARNDATPPAGYVIVGTHSNYNDSNWELDTIYCRPLQKQVGGVWYTVGVV